VKRGLLASREDLRNLRSRIGRRPYDTIYDLLQKRCALILQSRPITETDWQAQHAGGVWGAALTAARAIQGRIFDLIICHHIERNDAYRDRAIEEMRLLAAWSTWLDPSHRREDKADLCTAECCTTMALGLDWLADDLAEADRARCQHALRTKGLAAYKAAVAANDWWYTCYHNWNAVTNSGCGIGALVLADEDGEAAEVLDLARAGLEHFFAALGREGGWDEGIGYWGYALRYLLLFGIALDRIADDRMVFHQRGMEAMSQFGLYFSPRGHSASFGDSPAVPLYGALYAAADRFGSREICWWLDRWAFHRDVTTTGWSDAGLSLLLRPTEMHAEPKVKLSALKVFNEIGWAAVADHWPEPSMYVSVKTGDLSAHHSHLDMNTIQLQVDGENLLSDLGNPPMTSAYLFSGERYSFYEAQAQAHNTVVADERDHRIDAQGQILEAERGGDYRWVAAGAGAALGEMVRFNRHLVMLLDPTSGDGHTVVVLDEISNALAEKLVAYWHTFGELKFRGRAGRIVGRQSELHFRIGATAPVELAKGQHVLGKLTETVLSVTAEPTDDIAIATIFSRRPVKQIRLLRGARGEITLAAPTATIHFKGSRRHLKLERIEPVQA